VQLGIPVKFMCRMALDVMFPGSAAATAKVVPDK